jgi:hypothetical protein
MSVQRFRQVDRNTNNALKVRQQMINGTIAASTNGRR